MQTTNPASLFSASAAPVPKAKKQPRPARRARRKAMNASTLSDATRERLVGTALTRFVRDPAKPEELETLRYNLIHARVLSGMTAVEAAKALGYSNSTQLSLIESGERRVPENLRFLLDASRAYSVSIDFLLGVSPHTEPDGRMAHEHAIARHMADIGGAVGNLLASTMRQYMTDAYPTATEYRRVIECVEKVDGALSVMRERFGFDDAPGSAPLMRAIEQLTGSVEPMRPKLAKLKAIEDYMADMRRGLIPEVKELTESYNQIARQTQHELTM
jgi:transcriptional regulator with XRE-family HTH domain